MFHSTFFFMNFHVERLEGTRIEKLELKCFAITDKKSTDIHKNCSIRIVLHSISIYIKSLAEIFNKTKKEKVQN